MRHHAAAAILLLPPISISASCIAHQDDPTSLEPPDGAVYDHEEPTGDATEEIRNKITCREADRGIGCVLECEQALMFCAGGMDHPYSPSSGTGYLGMCERIGRVTACTFYWQNGDKCRVIPGKPTLCGYPGGRP